MGMTTGLNDKASEVRRLSREENRMLREQPNF